MDPDTPQRSKRRAFGTILLVALEVPAVCLTLYFFGFIGSTWTAAVASTVGVSVLIGLAVVWGLGQSRDNSDR